MENKRAILLVGAFGGVLPNLLRLAVDVQKTGMPEPTYWVGFGIWGICGALIALVWGETNLKKVLYLGLGLPSLLQLNFASLSTPNNLGQVSRMHAPKTMMVGFVTPAHAQPLHPQPLNVSGRTVHVVLDPRAPQGDGYEIAFFGNDETFISSVAVRPAGDPIAVPSRAAAAIVQFRHSRSSMLPLVHQSDAAVEIHVDVHHRTWSGLLRSFGARPGTEFQVNAHIVP